MKKGSKSRAVFLFLGMLLIVVFIVGLVCTKNPGTFIRADRYNFALEQFISFCTSVWLPAGILGIPIFLISLILSLVLDKKD